MGKYKNDVLQFIVWMRNGTAFCTSWFLFLLLVYNYFCGIQTITTNSLIKMMFFVMGGVFMFCVLFTRLFIKKWRFLSRLTGFIILICIYECAVFYWMGIFAENGTSIEWLVFIGIILMSYLLCVGIYRLYSKKKGELYTEALQKYQQQRRVENGE